MILCDGIFVENEIKLMYMNMELDDLSYDMLELYTLLLWLSLFAYTFLCWIWIFALTDKTLLCKGSHQFQLSKNNVLFMNMLFFQGTDCKLRCSCC